METTPSLPRPAVRSGDGLQVGLGLGMRRLDATLGPEEALRQCEALLRSGEGLRLLLPQLPPGSTLRDAARFRERLLQSQRRPSACMASVIEAS